MSHSSFTSLKPFFLLFIASFFVLSTTHAADIQNLKVVRSDSQLLFTWDGLSDADYDNADGYAVVWGDFTSDVLKNKYAKQYLNNVTSLSVRGAEFKRRTTYYFRVFTYDIEDGRNILKSGSQILKWKETDYDVYETESIVPNDPVIINSSSSTSSNSDDAIDWDFGVIRVLELDNFADVSWSVHTRMAKSDYDGFAIEVSKDSSFNEITGTLKTERGKIRARIEGLTPNTQYYVRGSFHKDDTLFGAGETKDFKTIGTIARDGKSIASRNLAKIEKRKYVTLNISDGSTSASSNTSSTTTTSTSTNTPSINTNDKDAVRARITAIEKQISTLQSELRTLKAKLGGSVSTRRSTTARTTPSQSTGRLSIRERLAERLAKLRAKQ